MPSNENSPDLYEIVLVYRDGSHLRENGGGDAECFADPPHDPALSHGSACMHLDESVQAFALEPLRAGLPYVAVQMPEGARPIIFRRRPAYNVLAGGQPQPAQSLTIVGWQKTIAGQNVKYMLSVAPDGSVAAASDDAAFEGVQSGQ